MREGKCVCVCRVCAVGYSSSTSRQGKAGRQVGVQPNYLGRAGSCKVATAHPAQTGKCAMLTDRLTTYLVCVHVIYLDLPRSSSTERGILSGRVVGDHLGRRRTGRSNPTGPACAPTVFPFAG